MRVVLLYNYAPTHLGGIEVVVDSLASEWARRGHDVVAIGSDVPEGRVTTRSSAYRIVGIPARNWIENHTGLPYPVPSPSILTTLRREVAAADVVHGHGFLALPPLLALGIGRTLYPRGPVRLLTEHVGHIPYEARWMAAVETVAERSVGRTTTSLAEGIVVFNGRVATELRTLAPRTPQKWIANGVDGRIYRPPADGERERLRAELGWDARPRVLFVGRLAPKKGAQLAAEAARLAGDAFELVMIGPSTGFEAPSPNVKVMGTLPFDRVAELYRACDAFLLPSLGEGFPLTAQEALGSGVPIFLGEDPAFGPHVAGAGASVTLLPRDAPVIARELTRFLADPHRREQARIDALAHARRSYSWERNVDEHESFIDELRRRR